MLSSSPSDAEIIQSLWPELRSADVRALGEGWMSRAVLVNGELVFRFAKHQDAVADARKEAALLPRLAPRLSVPIPNVTYFGARPESGLTVLGYRILPGEPLEGRLHDMTPENLQALACALARFLDELCTFPVDEALALGVPSSNFRAGFAEDRSALARSGVPLAPDVARYVEGRFAAYLDEPGHFAFEPRLLHADLSPDHLLVGGAEPRLSGIIDFGDTSVGDPDYEYLYLLADLGVAFVRNVMRARNEELSEQRLRKLTLFQTFDHVHSILGGVHYGRADLIAEGVAGLEGEARGAP